MNILDDNGRIVAVVTAVSPRKSTCEEGVWIEVRADDGTRPTLCLVKESPGGCKPSCWHLGVYRDALQPTTGYDLAVSFHPEDGPIVQVVKNGEVRIMSLFDLLDFALKPAQSQ